MPIRTQTASGGGTLIAIPAELAALWRGTLAPEGVKPPPGWSWGKACDFLCDYDRICDWALFSERTEYGAIAFIAVGGRQALALDAEIGTAWVALPDGGALVRNPVDERPPEELVRAAQASGFRPQGELELVEGRLFVFDSAFAGAADPEAITAHDGVVVAQPGPGRYQVGLASPGGCDVIRFTRL